MNSYNQPAKRALVTGGAGFIGSHLVDKLIEAGYTVTVFDNLSTGVEAYIHSGARFVNGDVRNEHALETVFSDGVDVVLHLAGQASIRQSFADPGADLHINTIGTVNVLKQCMAHRVPRLLFASSMTIYGNPNVVPTPETAPPAPVSYYAVTKYAAEQYVHLTAQRPDLDFDFHATSFRMFNVYGPRQSLTNAYQGVFAIFMGNLLRGEPITIHSDGEQSRDFVHVSDVARAWVASIDTEASFGQIINIGTGQPTTINQLCDMVLTGFDHTRRTYNVSTQSAQPGDVRVSGADIRRAQALLNWHPQIAFATGMSETVQWAKENVNLAKTNK